MNSSLLGRLSQPPSAIQSDRSKSVIQSSPVVQIQQTTLTTPFVSTPVNPAHVFSSTPVAPEHNNTGNMFVFGKASAHSFQPPFRQRVTPELSKNTVVEQKVDLTNLSPAMTSGSTGISDVKFNRDSVVQTVFSKSMNLSTNALKDSQARKEELDNILQKMYVNATIIHGGLAIDIGRVFSIAIFKRLSYLPYTN